MTPREQFEKLFPVPDGGVFNQGTREYHLEISALCDKDKCKAVIVYQTLWQGFQSGYVARGKPLNQLADEFPEPNTNNFYAGDLSALNDWGMKVVAAIKDQP